MNKYKALLGEIRDKEKKSNSGTDMQVSWIPSDVVNEQVFTQTLFCFMNIWLMEISEYSGGSKSELGIPNAIPILNILMFGFRMVRISNGPFQYTGTTGTDHSKTELFKMAALA